MKRVSRVVASVVNRLADGDEIDWPAQEGRADTASARQVLRDLKIVAAIAEVHRSCAQDPDGCQPLHVNASRRLDSGKGPFK